MAPLGVHHILTSKNIPVQVFYYVCAVILIQVQSIGSSLWYHTWLYEYLLPKTPLGCDLLLWFSSHPFRDMDLFWQCIVLVNYHFYL